MLNYISCLIPLLTQCLITFFSLNIYYTTLLCVIHDSRYCTNQTKYIPDPFAFVTSSLEASLAISIITSFQAYLLHPLWTFWPFFLWLCQARVLPKWCFLLLCWLFCLLSWDKLLIGGLEFVSVRVSQTSSVTYHPVLLPFSVDSASCDRKFSQLPFYSSHNLLLPPSLAYFLAQQNM